MKKKTKYKLKNDLTVAFWTCVFVCLAGAAVSSELFYSSFSRALTKLNEEPIAVITFKYKTAQRKFVDRTVWDRLRQNSPVYNGDTIHTSNLSEATVHFPDGNVMDLSENTMAQIFMTQDKTLVADLKDGEAFFDSSEADSGITLNAKGVEVTLEKGSSLSAKSAEGEEALSLAVVTGNAVIEGGQTLQEGSSLSFSNGETQTPSISVITPRVNSKILYHHEGTENIVFNWNVKNSTEDSKIFIEIAEDKKFENTVYKEEVTGLSSKIVPLENGVWHWKVYVDGGEKEEGRLQVIQSPAPLLIAPVSDYDYNFRTVLPAVRFIWSESPFASSYRITVADNSSFKNPVIQQTSSSTSFIIATLGEGKWWWKVEPYYTINRIGFSSVSKTGKFAITRKGTLVSPELFVPAKDTIVNSTSENSSIPFSWKNDSEAVSYSLVISRNENLSAPVASVSTADNFYRYQNEKGILPEGKYYWAVTETDSEGNISTKGEVRSFYSMKGNPEQHIVEPNDGYFVAASLLQDTRFTWKKNLSEFWETEFQISKDSSFKKIIYSEKTDNLSATVPSLATGTYWWRINSINKINDAQIATSSRQFTVLGNLDKPNILYPADRAVAREMSPFEYKWDAVEGADFYKVTVYDTENDVIVYDNNVYDTSVFIDMFHPKYFVDKNYYRMEIQAKAVAVPGISSRRMGDVSERTFQLLKLRPVEVKFPKRNAVLDGINSIIKPVYAEWDTVDEVSSAQFVLYKIENGTEKVIFSNPTNAQMDRGITVAPKKVFLDLPQELREGDYEIVVYAETLDGIDISNTESKNKGKFSVAPVEPLPEPEKMKVTPEAFDVAYLSNPENPRKMVFSWAPVKNATDYIIIIKDSEFHGRFIAGQMQKETEWEVDFVTMTEVQKRAIAKGTFDWTVEAIRRIDKDRDGILDTILQYGIRSYGTFTTDIPVPSESKVKGAKNPYAK